MMSTWAYATLTTQRAAAPRSDNLPNTTGGVTSYVDAVAALVPAEVLTLHAVILSFTTATGVDESGMSTTVITEPVTLTWAFFGMLILSVVLYCATRATKMDRFDWIRAAIPPVAFVAWTMLQRATAFDAVWPDLPEAPRTVSALFLAVILGVAASVLAKKAEGRDD